MGNKIIFLAKFLAIFCLLGCALNKMENDRRENGNIEENVSKGESRSTSPKLDSVYRFQCKENRHEILGKNINRAYFPRMLRDCLLKKGFEGDKEANIELANLIRLIGMKDFLVLGGDPKFRGPEVFEALLDIGYNQSPGYTHDGELTNKPLTFSFARYYIRMIETIGEFDDVADYVTDKYKWTQEEEFKLWSEDEIMYEYSEYLYKSVVEAWKEGKIVLKAYGEK